MFKYLLSTFIFISSLVFAKEDSLVVCCIFKNEARFLDEWVSFHLDQGASHIVMYNNASEDNYLQVLSKYIQKDQVVLMDWPYSYNTVEEWNWIQCAAYMDCATKLKGVVDWIAFLDTDEFLFSPKGKSLPRVLKSFKKYDAIGVNWVVYGSSGIERLQKDQRLIDYMIYRIDLDAPINTHVKSIVRPDKVEICVNPHFFHLKENCRMVNENKEPAFGPFNPNSVEILRINHYWSRDLNFLINEKLKRQQTWWKCDEACIRKTDASFNQICDPVLSSEG